MVTRRPSTPNHLLELFFAFAEVFRDAIINVAVVGESISWASLETVLGAIVCQQQGRVRIIKRHIFCHHVVMLILSALVQDRNSNLRMLPERRRCYPHNLLAKILGEDDGVGPPCLYSGLSIITHWIFECLHIKPSGEGQRATMMSLQC